MKPVSKKPKSDPDPKRCPNRLNREKGAAIAAYYENQSDDDAIAEAEAAYMTQEFTMMGVPVELVPKVQKLIGKRAW